MNHVLIVDDKEDNLYYLQALLSGHGWDVATALHGAEALVKARQDPPDLVISDLLMPVMDGYTLLRHWKADARLKRIPFIVYTATYTEPEDERLALSLGADAFILKPAEPDDFIARMREVQDNAARLAPALPLMEAGEDELLRSYSETLIRKLEEKTLQLEETNKQLQEDIAERKRVLDQLRASEERFREVAETIQEVFWVTDPSKDRMLYISPAYERIWGRTCASLYESPRGWMDAIHPDDRDRVRRAAETEQGTPGAYDETYRIVRGDGSLRWIRDRAFPVFAADGEVLRVVGTAEDVTNRRELEEQFRRAQKMEAIGHLAGGVAHDFNNILTAILGNTELALADVPEGSSARQSLEEIRKAGARAAMLVQQILSFSSQQPQERRVISLGPIIAETVGFLRATVPSVVELVTTFDDDAPPVLADPTQIHQVIANLCTNAWHSLEGGRGRIEIKLGAATLDSAAAGRLAGLRPGLVTWLSVSDTGKGMDAATIEHIYDPFFTTKEPGKGTGLGLSVVHGIVQGHDGAITVDSEPGRGTTFCVYFPAATDLLSATEPPPASGARRGDGQHVLYIDDEEPLVFLAKRMLERLGYRVTGFNSAADAMQAFFADPEQFDLVIADLNMPGVSGLQLASDLLKVRPDLPVVLCSGHVTEDLKERARHAGICEVLYKPNTMEEFSEAIQRLAISSDRSRATTREC